MNCRRLGITRRRWALAEILLLLFAAVSNAFVQSPCIRRHYTGTHSSRTTQSQRTFPELLPSTSTTTSVSMAKDSSSNKGVYSRPSAAIERGSGFFIPGLEGPRVRLVFGIVVLVLTVLNHVLLSSNLPTVAFPERVAVIYAVLLLIQAAIEFGKEEKGYVVTLETDTSQQEMESGAASTQTWSTSTQLSDEAKERVQWAAASYLSLTPATYMMLLNRSDGVVYRLGAHVAPAADVSSTEMEGTRAAFATLDKSSGGRVSLPSTHPAVVALQMDEEYTRCVVLQKIDDDSCWMMTSNQLLPAFTKDDLKWLGQLAKHVNQ